MTPIKVMLPGKPNYSNVVLESSILPRLKQVSSRMHDYLSHAPQEVKPEKLTQAKSGLEEPFMHFFG